VRYQFSRDQFRQWRRKSGHNTARLSFRLCSATPTDYFTHWFFSYPEPFLLVSLAQSNLSIVMHLRWSPFKVVFAFGGLVSTLLMLFVKHMIPEEVKLSLIKLSG
jgi:hypothetical protein